MLVLNTSDKHFTECALTSYNTAWISITEGCMIDGSSAELLCFCIWEVPAVPWIQHTVSINGAWAYTEAIAWHAVSIIVYVVEARTLKQNSWQHVTWMSSKFSKSKYKGLSTLNIDSFLKQLLYFIAYKFYFFYLFCKTVLPLHENSLQLGQVYSLFYTVNLHIKVWIKECKGAKFMVSEYAAVHPILEREKMTPFTGLWSTTFLWCFLF